MSDPAERKHFTLTIEVVRNELGLFIQTTRDGRVSAAREDIAADIALALPALGTAVMGRTTEVPDA